MPETYIGLKNTNYSPSSKIGQGGEGTVFEVMGSANLVLKIYSDPLVDEKIEKLIFMTSLLTDELQKFAAWPLDVVKDNKGNVCGLVMKKLEGYVPLHNLFSPMDRKKLFPDKGYNFLVHVARNLATAFFKIHEMGIVVGDVNEANILVNSTGMVSLIDCDSFQIKNGNRYYFCEVGIPRYTPPELLERGSFTNVIRTTNTDNFSLSTLIFQLLFLGRAPFTGINPNKQEIDEETAIKTREFAYSLQRTNKKLFPAKNSLEFTSLPAELIGLFHKSFEDYPIRPVASQWINELQTLSKELVQCGKSKIHFFPKKAGICPWCRFKSESNIMYFLDDSYLKAAPQLDNIDLFIQGFRLEPLVIKKLQESPVNTHLHANSIDEKFKKLKRTKKFIISILIVVFTLMTLISLGFLFVGVFAILVANKLSQKKLKEELNRRQFAYDSLNHSKQSVISQHNSLSQQKNYAQISNKIAGLIENFKDLPNEFAWTKKKTEEKHYQQKYNQYLQQFDIRNHTIPSFGAAKKLTIYNSGICNAADINKLRSIKIAGIGPKNIQILFDWQRHVGAGFVYTPDLNLLNSEINIASDALKNKRQKLEAQIKTEYNILLATKANVLSSASTFEQQYQSLLPQIQQAELELEAFKQFLKKGK
ncbi:protein kinase domain-containing protein [Taibaiella soli]|uniref:Protein kinase domain-containing protein n=1 Tax=Taibaiella soli TaxID=1649169 RepID=A0A2W2BVN7_9BACT|nr:protein kinase [Taibaiella soli]PZF71873.1 hypothetical protein DN068_17615 [Taibaiella soli]